MSLSLHAQIVPSVSPPPGLIPAPGPCPAVQRAAATDAAHAALDHAAALVSADANGWTVEKAEADQAFRMATVYIARALRLAGDERAVAALLHQVCDWETGR